MRAVFLDARGDGVVDDRRTDWGRHRGVDRGDEE